MQKYVLIESRDPFESKAVEAHYRLAAALAEAGDEVTLVLVQNGVLPARPEARTALDTLPRAGVTVLADELSLRERGLSPSRLAPGVRPASMEAVVDGLAEGRKVLWL
jgi:sulfur relay (sulfurtransferase) complex TusBCD TusD component (DsrE family)